MAKKPARPASIKRKTYHFSVWVNEELRREFEEAAAKAKEERVSTWLRKLGVQAVEDGKKR